MLNSNSIIEFYRKGFPFQPRCPVCDSFFLRKSASATSFQKSLCTSQKAYRAFCYIIQKSFILMQIFTSKLPAPFPTNIKNPISFHNVRKCNSSTNVRKGQRKCQRRLLSFIFNIQFNFLDTVQKCKADISSLLRYVISVHSKFSPSAAWRRFSAVSPNSPSALNHNFAYRTFKIFCHRSFMNITTYFLP